IARILPRVEGASPLHGNVPMLAAPMSLAPSSLPIAADPASFDLRWVVLLWVVGVTLSALRALVAWWRAQELRRRDVRPAEGQRSPTRALAARLGLARPVEVLVSLRTSGPITLGWWRPVILLPLSTVTALTPSEIEMVLAHELAHIARRDYL